MPRRPSGVCINVGPRGIRTTVGLPGNGVSYIAERSRGGGGRGAGSGAGGRIGRTASELLEWDLYQGFIIILCLAILDGRVGVEIMAVGLDQS